MSNGDTAKTQRVCFQLQVEPARLDEYRERHASVWPEMLQAIADAGRRNYSLFLREDGLLIGYYETDDDDAAQARLEADPRTKAWEADMSGFFVQLSGRPDQSAIRLPEIFNLDDQLSRASGTASIAPTDADSPLERNHS
jgi:L-rhamnose mutarotase